MINIMSRCFLISECHFLLFIYYCFFVSLCAFKTVALKAYKEEGQLVPCGGFCNFNESSLSWIYLSAALLGFIIIAIHVLIGIPVNFVLCP